MPGLLGLHLAVEPSLFVADGFHHFAEAADETFGEFLDDLDAHVVVKFFVGEVYGAHLTPGLPHHRHEVLELNVIMGMPHVQNIIEVFDCLGGDGLMSHGLNLIRRRRLRHVEVLVHREGTLEGGIVVVFVGNGCAICPRAKAIAVLDYEILHRLVSDLLLVLKEQPRKPLNEVFLRICQVHPRVLAHGMFPTFVNVRIVFDLLLKDACAKLRVGLIHILQSIEALPELVVTIHLLPQNARAVCTDLTLNQVDFLVLLEHLDDILKDVNGKVLHVIQIEVAILVLV